MILKTGQRPKGLRTWVEIDSRKIAENYRIFRKLVQKETRLMAVVKSNAYGHGLVDFAKKIEHCGADYLGVDSITEAIRLRKEGIKIPILVLGYTLPENFPLAVKNDIEITLSSVAQLDALLNFKTKRKITVHVKIDTGMHRQGFYSKECEKVAKKMHDAKNISVKGIYTHFANGKNPSFPNDSKKQIEEFQVAKNNFENNNFTGILKHTCATSGTILYPEYHYDMVRIGIGLYGLWPSGETRSAYENVIRLRPALSWKAIVSEVKEAKKGERIGYDFTETFGKDTKIAIVPIGYWHGYARLLSSIGHVLISGKRARVIGRVSMDMIAVDISNLKNVRAGSIVTLLGKDRKEKITADEIATLCGTTNYEIITRINSRIKRFYI